jgi:LacI family transcriptional regulator
MSSSRSNLREVAHKAGVSPATVSRVLNRPDLVAESTRARVLAAAAELDFEPSPSARALSRGRSYVMGALIPHIGYSVFADYIDAVQIACHAAGYSLVMGAYHFDMDEELRQARRLVHSGVDALILVGFKHRPELFELLDANDVKYVCTDVFDPKSPHPCIGYDNRGAGRRIAAHFIAAGHKRFAMVTGDTRRNDRMALRLEGFRAELRKHGFPLPADAVFQGDYTIAEGSRGFSAVYAASQPTAVMCGNDVLAVGALLEARKHGLSIPDDVEITGFDNLEWAAAFTPPLTTMHVPCTEMGRGAAELLLARMEGRDAPHAVALPLALVERETTRPAVT